MWLTLGEICEYHDCEMAHDSYLRAYNLMSEKNMESPIELYNNIIALKFQLGYYEEAAEFTKQLLQLIKTQVLKNNNNDESTMKQENNIKKQLTIEQKIEDETYVIPECVLISYNYCTILDKLQDSIIIKFNALFLLCFFCCFLCVCVCV